MKHIWQYLLLLTSILVIVPASLAQPHKAQGHSAVTTTSAPSILIAACKSEAISNIGGVTKTDGVAPMGASDPTNCADIGFGVPMPVSGKLKHLTVSGSPNNQNVAYDPTDGAVVVFLNGSETGLTCALGNNTACNDRTHSVRFKAGDLLEIQITVQTYATSCGQGCTNYTGGYSPLRVTLAKQ
jgi:hypothetical protein